MSILTDQLQSLFIFGLISIVALYLAVTFRPGELPPLPTKLGVTEMGISSFATVGIALISSSIFSDAIWYAFI